MASVFCEIKVNSRHPVTAGVIPLELPKLNKASTLHFYEEERICLAGMAMFVLSLILPAAKMGSGPTLGRIWFVMGSMSALSMNGTEASNLSIIALLMNAGCLLSIIGCFNRWNSPRFIILVAHVCAICALILLLRPYSGFERLYAGYYLWLLSVVIIAVIPIKRIFLRRNAVTTG